MLKQVPFANAAAAAVAGLYLVFWLIFLVSPELFRLVYNANFLGADAASVLPPKTDIQTVLTALIVVAALSWVWGYFFVWFYNKWVK